MSVRDFDIDPRVADLLEAQGISDFYPPQKEALKHALSGENLVLAIPTASGKSLVAYLTMLRAVLRGQKALYIVPLRALATEKFEELQEFAQHLGFTVGISTSDLDSVDPRLDSYDVLVATSEKTDSLLRHRADWFSDLAVAVSDEVHLINDANRGPTLETVIARLRHINDDMQIVALSATIRNSEEIAVWLDAKHVQSDWRPVSLKKGIFFGRSIVFDDDSIVEVPVKGSTATDRVAALVQGTLDEGGQALIFVSSRRYAESAAEKVGLIIGRTLNAEDREKLAAVADEIMKKQSEATTTGASLAACVKNGVAYHHAGLTNVQRGLIEKNFKNRTIKCIAATPTLAAGINLPSRRVIVRDLTRYDANEGQKYLPVLEVHQMMGRAGRPKYDSAGEAVLIAKNMNDRDALAEKYILAESEKIYSKLGAEPALRMNILAAIATGFVRNREELERFIDGTFYAQQGDTALLASNIDNVLTFLSEKTFITIKGDAPLKQNIDGFTSAGALLKNDGAKKAQTFETTRLGKRIAELYLDPLSATVLLDALKKAEDRDACSPIAYLHVIAATPDMQTLYLRKGDYDYVEQKIDLYRDEFLRTVAEADDYEFFMAEVKTALVLENWIDETSEDSIVQRFNVGPGDIRNMTERAEWLLYSMRELARIEHSGCDVDLRTLIKRVRYGIKKELLPLISLRGVGRARARALFRAGFTDISALRSADVAALAKVPGIGSILAENIKKQVDADGALDSAPAPEEIPTQKKQGQTTLSWGD